jgi:hypothetical protein
MEMVTGHRLDNVSWDVYFYKYFSIMGSWLHSAISGMPFDLGGFAVLTVTRKLVSAVPICTCYVLWS